MTLRELVAGFIEQGLRQPEASPDDTDPDKDPLPMAIPARGIPISLTPKDIHRIEEEEDLERFARSS